MKELNNLVSICTKEFFTHPNWNSVLDLLRYYIEDLHSIDSINTQGKTNDEIATELRARQITKERIESFINDSLVLKKAKESVLTTTRKYK